MLIMEESKENIISLKQWVTILYKRGTILYQKGNFEAAASYLQKALQFDAENCKVLYQLGNVFYDLGNHEVSNDVFEKLLKLDDSYDDCYYLMAWNYACLGLFEQAKVYVEKYLEKSADEEPTEEILDLLEIIQLEEEGGFSLEDELMTNQEEAIRCIRICDYEKAISLLEDVLGDCPECWSAYNHLAIAFFKKGDDETAMNILEDLLERNPGNLYGLCNQMLFFHSLERKDEVMNLLSKLTHVYPLCAEQQAKLGISFAAIGEEELGFKWLYLLYKNGYMGDISFYYWLVRTAYTKGKEHVAKAAWKIVLELDKDFEGHAPWN